MKVVMTLLVRNEEDIVRENIEFHLSQGVSFFIATDNLSVDGTAPILKEYEAKGLLRYFFEESDQFDQHKWVTQMAVLAFEEYGADWVINNDADEFWWPQSGNLIDVFGNVPEGVYVTEARRKNFVWVEAAEKEAFYECMIYRQSVPTNSLGRPLPSKVAHRGSSDIVVAPGNHSVSGFCDNQTGSVAIDVLHFPMRSQKQFESKIRIGGAAYERNMQLPEGIGITWRKLYSELNQKGSLGEYCGQNLYDIERVQDEISKGQIVEDRRLMNYFLDLHNYGNFESMNE